MPPLEQSYRLIQAIMEDNERNARDSSDSDDSGVIPGYSGFLDWVPQPQQINRPYVGISQLRTGDIVEVIGQNGHNQHRFPLGTECEIIRECAYENGWFNVRRIDSTESPLSQDINHSNLVFVSHNVASSVAREYRPVAYKKVDEMAFFTKRKIPSRNYKEV